MTVWSEAPAGFVAQERDARAQVVIYQTFRVGRGETRTSSDTILHIRPSRRGDIAVHGNLILRDCLLLWEQTEHQQTRLRIEEGGTLRATNCHALSSNLFWVNWEFESGATVVFDRFVGDPWTSIPGAVDCESTNRSTVKMTIQTTTRGSRIRIRDAHHLWLEIFPPAYRTGDVAFARRRQWVDWTIADLGAGYRNRGRGLVPLRARHQPDTREPHHGPGTTDGLGIGWAICKNTPGFVDCEIVGFGAPGSDGTHYAERTWEIPRMDASLTLIDSRLEKVWPTTWGYVHLVVRNSNLAEPRVWGGPATYEIYGSTLDVAAAYAGGRMYLEDCEVRQDIEVKDADTVVYGYGLRGQGGSDVLEIDGGRFVQLESAGPPW